MKHCTLISDYVNATKLFCMIMQSTRGSPPVGNFILSCLANLLREGVSNDHLNPSPLTKFALVLVQNLRNRLVSAQAASSSSYYPYRQFVNITTFRKANYSDIQSGRAKNSFAARSNHGVTQGIVNTVQCILINVGESSSSSNTGAKG